MPADAMTFDELVASSPARPNASALSFDDLVPQRPTPAVSAPPAMSNRAAAEMAAVSGNREAVSKLPNAAASEDSWLTTIRKAGENFLTGVEQAGAGLVQSLTERSPDMAEDYIAQRGGGQATSRPDVASAIGGDLAASRRGIEAAGERGELPGQATAKRTTAEIKANAPNVPEWSAKGIVSNAIVSLGQMLPGTVATVLTRSPVPALGSLGAQVYGQKYAQARTEGRAPEDAHLDGVFYTAAELIPEGKVVGEIISKAGKSAVTRALRVAGAEGLSEGFTAVLQTSYDAGVVGKDMTLGEAVNQIALAMTTGAVMGGGLSVASEPFQPRDSSAVPPAAFPATGPTAPVLPASNVTPPSAPVVPEIARAAVASITPEDDASPIGNDLIAGGRALIAQGALGRSATPVSSVDLPDRIMPTVRPTDAEALFASEGDEQIGWFDPKTGRKFPLDAAAVPDSAPVAESVDLNAPPPPVESVPSNAEDLAPVVVSDADTAVAPVASQNRGEPVGSAEGVVSLEEVGDGAVGNTNRSADGTQPGASTAQPQPFGGVPSEGLAENAANPAPTESVENGGVRQASAASSLLDIQPALDGGYDALDVPARRRVLDAVRAAVQDDKVFRSVVEAVPVDVMNDLAGPEGSADSLRSDSAMFVNALARNDALPVGARAIGAVVSRLALPVAVVPVANAGGRAADRAPAGVASDIDGQGSAPLVERQDTTTDKSGASPAEQSPVPSAAGTQGGAGGLEATGAPASDEPPVARGGASVVSLTDKSVIVRGASAADMAAIKAALPEKVVGLPNKTKGGLVFPKRYEPSIRASLESVAAVADPTAINPVATGLAVQTSAPNGPADEAAAAGQGSPPTLLPDGTPLTPERQARVDAAPPEYRGESERYYRGEQQFDVRSRAEERAFAAASLPADFMSAVEFFGRNPYNPDAVARSVDGEPQDGSLTGWVTIRAGDDAIYWNPARGERTNPRYVKGGKRPRTLKFTANDVRAALRETEREGAAGAVPGVAGDEALPAFDAPLEQVTAEQLADAAPATQRIADTSRRVLDFVVSLGGKGSTARIDLGLPSAEAVQAADAVGVDLRGFRRVLQAQDAAHVLRTHGNPGTEAARGQVALTPADIARYPEIVDAPDRVTASTTQEGLPALLSEKRIGDDYFVVEELRSKRRMIGLKTMWKRPAKVPPGRVATAEAGDGQTSETWATPDSINKNGVINKGGSYGQRSQLAEGPVALDDANTADNDISFNGVGSQPIKAEGERLATNGPAITSVPDDFNIVDLGEALNADDSARTPLEIEAMARDLSERMRALGIDQKVALKLVAVMRSAQDGREIPDAQGTYYQRLIQISLSARDGISTLNHEAVHALRDLGLFKPAEWRSLERAARVNLKGMADVRRRYADRGLNENDLVEEAVADMFADWATERKVPPTGFMRDAWKRVKGFLAAVYDVLTGNGFTTVESIFRAVESGRVGGRPIKADRRQRATDRERFDLVSPSGAGRNSPRSNPFGNGDGDIGFSDKAALGLVGSLRERLPSSEAIGQAVDSWRTMLQDRYLPVLRVEQKMAGLIGRNLSLNERPYLTEELMTGKIGAQMDRLTDQHIGPLYEAMHRDEVTTDELETYLYARHAPERNARISEINERFDEGAGSGMTDAEASDLMAAIAESGKLPALEGLAARIDTVLSESVDARVESGLLSQAEADAWRAQYKFYVPLRGRSDLLDSDRPRRGSGINIKGAESKRAFGRVSKADDILAYAIMQAQESIIRSETNRVGQSFLELARVAPEAKLWTVNKVDKRPTWDEASQTVVYRAVNRISAEDADYTVTTKVEGVEHRVTMNRQNPEAVKIAEAMRNLGNAQLPPAVKVMMAVNRYLSLVNTTLNPEFIITNAFRDIQTASINLQQYDMPGITKDTVLGYRGALTAVLRSRGIARAGKWDAAYQEYSNAGAKVYFNDVGDVDSLRRKMEQDIAVAKPGLTARKAWISTFALIEKLNLAVDNATRLSAYQAVRERGMSVVEAASLAKNLTVNFNRRGTYGPLINSAYLFYNASVQGTAVMLSAMRSPRVRKVLAAAVATGVMLDMLNRMLSDDDDDGQAFYDKIPEFDKQRNLIIMLPGQDGRHIKFPLPYGYNVFFALGRNAVEAANGKPLDKVLTSAVTVIADSFNPIGGSGGLLNIILPTVIDPIYDIARNRDYADKPIAPEQPEYGPTTPDNQRYFGSVSPLWRVLAKGLNDGSGGDDVLPGAVDVSPETMEYVFGVVTGASGQFFGRLTGLAAKIATGEEVGTGDLPMVRKVVGDKARWVDKAMFYERAKAIEQAKEYLKDYDAVDRAKGDAYLAENKSLLSLERSVKFTRKALGSIRRERAADGLTMDEKRAINDREGRIIMGFNTLYNERMKVGVYR